MNEHWCLSITEYACQEFGSRCAAIISSLIDDGLAPPHIVFNAGSEEGKRRSMRRNFWVAASKQLCTTTKTALQALEPTAAKHVEFDVYGHDEDGDGTS